jgi:hypothetical protein
MSSPSRFRTSVLAAALALTAGAALAAERPFCANRPGKATPPCILDAGRWQLEAAVLDYQDETYAVAGFELRRGLTARTEASLAWTPIFTGRHTGGTGDLQLNLRTALTDPDGEGAQVALQGFVTAPTATHGQGAGGWEGGLLAPVAVPLGGLSLGAAPEVAAARDADGRGTHLAYAAAVGLSHAFGPLTAGVELWGRLDDDPAGRTRQASADLTAAYVPSRAPDLQFDAGLNAGLNRQTPDLEVYVGVARRF